MHALEALSNWRDVDRLFSTDRGAIPESAFKFRPFRKGQLGQEQSQNDESFTKRNRSKQGSCNFRQPLRTCTWPITSHPKVAQQLCLGFFHRQNALLWHTTAQELQELSIR